MSSARATSGSTVKKIETLADFLGHDEPSPPPAFRELTVQEFCRGILQSQEYRQSVLDRVTLGTLPAAVECKMYEYAYGKPPDRVEHTGKDGQPIETITEVRRVIVRVNVDQQQDEPSYVTH